MAAKKAKSDVLLEAAQALRPREVTQLSFDPLQAKHAVSDGLKALQKHRAALQRSYPGFVLAELEVLPELCDRIAEQQRVVQKASSAGAVAEVASPAQLWRRQLLLIATGLSLGGGVDARSLAAIERGSGLADNLRDVLDLAVLLAPHRTKVEALHGPGALAKAEQAARTALDALGGGTDRSVLVKDAAALRDRYATLVVLRHDRLRAAR